jgi:hypothetical protein
VRKIQETRAEEEVAGAGVVAEALVEAQTSPRTAQLLRKTVEREGVVEAGDEVGVVVEAVEGVEEETELSRKDKDQRIRSLHHNPVVPASLVVA